MQFDATEQALIGASFRALAVDAPGAAACFYRHLFRLLPEAENLFVADMRRQGVKLAQTLQVIVDQVGNWGLLRVTVEDLAIRHLAYGVRPEHYDAVGEALIAMLRERLGAFCTEETVFAWRKAYTGIQAVMLEFAYPAEADSDTESA
ncbi:globin domain-containing protein [Mesorhizobium sp. LHD-90]|uniref:globin domain-containing protein n=1 Tax=Mesorhizobium sp. LHD-90 TaxID=3071414 RepID=UPI0027E034F6|nr:globin domain-containing protein [Mesorhizobium sp. LHD-90]MDQ6432512.1 globin domain-containing protein [Mesorhizobium sp. LHD-90]